MGIFVSTASKYKRPAINLLMFTTSSVWVSKAGQLVQHMLLYVNQSLLRILGVGFNHGCHRHQFSKFPDFSLIKVKFP